MDVSEPAASSATAPTSSEVLSGSLAMTNNNTTGANVNAKPFVPRVGAAGVAARPFTSTANGDVSQKVGGFSPTAAAFVPAATASAPRSQSMSTAAPAFVPRGAADAATGRAARAGVRADQRYPEADFSALQYPAARAFGASDLRVPSAHAMQGPVPLVDPRGAFGSGGRLGRGRSPVTAAVPHTFVPGQLRGSRGSPGRPGDSSSRGRGRGRSPGGFHAPTRAYLPGADALERTHRAAQAALEQLVPQLQSQTYLTLVQMSAEAQAASGLPETVQQYHSLHPLEDPAVAEDSLSRALGVQSLVLKAVSATDGQAYALRRLGRRQVHASPDAAAFASEVVDAWSGLGRHPQLAVPRNALVVGADDGGPPSLFVAHDYFPGAATLEAAHLQPQVTANGLVQVAGVPEDTLWSYMLQFAAALRAVHSAGMAFRAALHPSKVLLISPGRICIGSLGVAEMAAGAGSRHADAGSLQREDLGHLGRLLLQLACATPQHVSLEVCAAHFSPELTRIVACLLGHQEAISTWQQLTSALGDRALAELDARNVHADFLTAALAHELENGRLLRALSKLSMVTERADADAEWAETGDRYLLKLFRDFVFHQSTEEGAPILEWGHVAECLNKLDAGVPERVVLLSRDEASMLVVSYADLKRCVEAAFGELRRLSAATRPLTPPPPGGQPR